MACKVLIVDDQIVPRQLFENIIASSDRYEIAASLDSASLADVYCAGGGVDLVLMDVVMGDGSNGLDAAARIKSSYPRIRIIVVTSMPDAVFLKRAREIGVDSFWYKEVQELPMLEVMDRTMAGERIYPDSPPVKQLGMALSTDLTERELDVLRLLAEGLTDREIGERLNLGVTTVRYHLNNLIGKTGYASRTELAVNAVLSGITIPGITG
ncbi:MAG: response regulator transcription factor [Oscillospiraceae bacterium]|nr:response regulator transcription factor [Oscillospiraceae bacterium]